MKTLNIVFITLLLSISSFSLSAHAERYRSRSESKYDRYESKGKSEKKRFDNNLNRYNNYSPKEKKDAAKKWRNFKEETTPAEREYILNKLREKKRYQPRR